MGFEPDNLAADQVVKILPGLLAEGRPALVPCADRKGGMDPAIPYRHSRARMKARNWSR
jgi:hypothetical protein